MNAEPMNADDWLASLVANLGGERPASTWTVAGFPASSQQTGILWWFKNGHGNLLARARAGCGKTSTTLEGVELAPERSVLLAAFGKAIADELQSRIDRPGAVAKTLHALGYSFVTANWKARTNRERPKARAMELAMEAAGPGSPREALRLVAELHTKAREVRPLAESVGEIAMLAARFDLVADERLERSGWTAARIADAAFNAMTLAKRRTDTIDYADMIFLPLVHGWVRPMFDLVVVDEAQDMTTAQLAMAIGACARGGRVFIAGDDRQNLYSFRGTEHDGIDRLKAELRAEELPLTITRRCPRLAVELAAAIVPDFVAAPDAPEGVVDEMDADRMIAAVRVGDFVLSRKNAPLVRVCMRLLKRNVRATIRGNDVGKGILALVERLDAVDVDDLRHKVSAWAVKEIARARKNLDEEGAAERISAVLDQQSVVDALLEDCEDVRDLTRRCDALFAREDDKRPTVVCSSVHRAKGLEADTVFLMRNTFRFDGTIDEQNILYVAITRTKRRLVWVDGEPS